MSKAQLQEILNRQTQELARRRRIKLLSDGLMFALGIAPLERNLVVWLATNARTNRDAVERWVSKQIGEAESTGDDQASLLRQRLLLRIEAIREVGA